MYAPFTPIEFFDASFHDGSEHTLWCLRNRYNAQFEALKSGKPRQRLRSPTAQRRLRL
jgi:hypothetical protein